MHGNITRQVFQCLMGLRPGWVGTYSEDPETGAIECDTVHCWEVAQDSPVQAHALIVADGTDGAEALGPRQLPPSEDLHCWWKSRVKTSTLAGEEKPALGWGGQRSHWKEIFVTAQSCIFDCVKLSMTARSKTLARTQNASHTGRCEE